MIAIRHFRNDDSPGVAAVWSAQPRLRGRLDRMTPTLLEQFILSKPYFEPRGLLVACEAGAIVGFVHAGFTPSSRTAELIRERGVVSMLMVTPRPDAAEIAAPLLDAGEKYLQDGGAVELLGGGCGIHAPFYLGLYGGCRLPGVLVEDRLMREAFQNGGYAEHRQVTIWQRPLAAFRPPVDRELLALRRQYRLQVSTDDPVRTWNDACAYSWSDPVQWSVESASSQQRVATLTFWNMEPLASSWGQRVQGLADLVIQLDSAGSGFATCFLGEAMRQFQSEGVSLAEIHTTDDDAALTETCKKLGFQPVDRGIQFVKQRGASAN